MRSQKSAAATLQGLYGTDNGAGSFGGQRLQPAQMQLALTHAPAASGPTPTDVFKDSVNLNFSYTRVRSWRCA